MKVKSILCFALIGSINLCHALTSPINGTYVATTFGMTYDSPIENVLLPLQSEYTGNNNVVAITGIYPSFGGNFGLMVGRRFKDRYRLELEFATAYSTLKDVKYTVSATPTGTDVRGYISTFGSLIVNGFIDLFPSDGDFKRASPYFGLGAGSAYIATKIEAYNGDTFVATLQKIKKSTSITQAIFGISYFLDDYTWMGVDYRVQRYGKIEELGDSFMQHNINLTANFTLDN